MSVEPTTDTARRRIHRKKFWGRGKFVNVCNGLPKLIINLGNSFKLREKKEKWNDVNLSFQKKPNQFKQLFLAS